MAASLQEACSFLENYWCRNQVFRTVQFSSALLGGVCESSHPRLSGKLVHLYGSFSNMRVMLRLLDDLPALAYTLKAWSSSNKDTPLLSRLVELVSALCGLFYYPFEHAAWLADNNIISSKSTSFWTVAIVLWGVPLVISVLQSVLALLNINRELELAWKREKTVTAEKRVTFSDRREYSGVEPEMRALMTRRFHIILSLVQSLSDLMNAVHWLPEGFLWSGKLPLFWVGMFGTVSSVIGLYKILPASAV